MTLQLKQNILCPQKNGFGYANKTYTKIYSNRIKQKWSDYLDYLSIL